MSPRHLLGEHVLLRRGSRANPGQGGQITSLGWLGTILVSPLGELREVATKRAYAEAAYSLIIIYFCRQSHRQISGLVLEILFSQFFPFLCGICLCRSSPKSLPYLGMNLSKWNSLENTYTHIQNLFRAELRQVC